MNARALLMVMIACATAVGLRAADHVDLAALPTPVRETVHNVANGEPVSDIGVEHEQGRRVYIVRLRGQTAPLPELRIAEDGSLLADTRATSAAHPSFSEYGEAPSVYLRLRLDDLTPDVQRTIRREAGNREIASIQETSIDGHSAYRVEFKESGRDPRLYVATDGTVLRPTEKPALIGTTLGDLPEVARDTVRHEVGTDEIVAIHRGSGSDRVPVYDLEVRGRDGEYRLSIAQDGSVVSDSRRR